MMLYPVRLAKTGFELTTLVVIDNVVVNPTITTALCAKDTERRQTKQNRLNRK